MGGGAPFRVGTKSEAPSRVGRGPSFLCPWGYRHLRGAASEPVGVQPTRVGSPPPAWGRKLTRDRSCTSSWFTPAMRGDTVYCSSGGLGCQHFQVDGLPGAIVHRLQHVDRTPVPCSFRQLTVHLTGDLPRRPLTGLVVGSGHAGHHDLVGPLLYPVVVQGCLPLQLGLPSGDRKSTRLNSSHVAISYAVFCLKKKNTNRTNASEVWLQ